LRAVPDGREGAGGSEFVEVVAGGLAADGGGIRGVEAEVILRRKNEVWVVASLGDRAGSDLGHRQECLCYLKVKGAARRRRYENQRELVGAAGTAGLCVFGDYWRVCVRRKIWHVGHCCVAE
jgi:hypothetical protein